mmetsp:Transcript_10955/g.19570  ORF Transcript_10955/g.19570 Transcript_10955/m.19570 type:complete len:85 (-) Transcript_10955:48-302(-)
MLIDFEGNPAERSVWWMVIAGVWVGLCLAGPYGGGLWPGPGDTCKCIGYKKVKDTTSMSIGGTHVGTRCCNATNWGAQDTCKVV